MAILVAQPVLPKCFYNAGNGYIELLTALPDEWKDAQSLEHKVFPLTFPKPRLLLLYAGKDHHPERSRRPMAYPVK